jgi:transcriptional regulator with XRE-family HTH domain
MIDLVKQLEPERTRSPLAQARLARHWTREEAANRSGLTPDEIEWLEEGRVYRFASTDDALLAAWLYAAGLDLDRREARQLAGLPVPPTLLARNLRVRLAAVTAIALAAAAFAAVVTFLPRGGGDAAVAQRPQRAASLPPAWQIKVHVLNGAGDIHYTRRVASRIGALAYNVTSVTRADRFDYPQTAVYYPPGAESIGVRLARQLGVVAKPLPGGKDPLRLVVIVGPQKGPG